jgi:acyl dehydratase
MQEIDRSMIGTATTPFIVEVEKGAIRRFCEALGEDNKLFIDEDYAKARGFLSLVAPPTFPISFLPPHRQPWLAKLDEGRLLAGEQDFSYQRPLVAGDVLTCALHLVDIEEKHGRSGMMHLFQQELRATDGTGVTVMRNRRMVVYRSHGKLSK